MVEILSPSNVNATTSAFRDGGSHLSRSSRSNPLDQPATKALRRVYVLSTKIESDSQADRLERLDELEPSKYHWNHAKYCMLIGRERLDVQWSRDEWDKLVSTIQSQGSQGSRVAILWVSVGRAQLRPEAEAIGCSVQSLAALVFVGSLGDP